MSAMCIRNLWMQHQRGLWRGYMQYCSSHGQSLYASYRSTQLSMQVRLDWGKCTLVKFIHSECTSHVWMLFTTDFISSAASQTFRLFLWSKSSLLNCGLGYSGVTRSVACLKFSWQIVSLQGLDKFTEVKCNKLLLPVKKGKLLLTH